MSDAAGKFDVEWIHPIEGTITPPEPLAGGDKRTLKAPVTGPVVLYLQKQVVKQP